MRIRVAISVGRRDLVRMVAEAMGAQVFEAATCDQAFDVLSRERSRVRLVLLDYFMPGLQPSECACALSQSVAPETSIVLCTAAVDARRKAAELGLTGWLAKPFSLPQLERLIQEAVPS
jgi:CheY-like chemotaxis protein